MVGKLAVHVVTIPFSINYGQIYSAFEIILNIYVGVLRFINEK